MKKQSENKIALNSNENATSVVNQNNVSSKTKTFTVVDMWNIQRRSVTMYQRRNCA